MEGLARPEIAHHHGEVDAAADTRCVAEELNAGFGGRVGFYEDEVDVDEVEDRYHCWEMLVGVGGRGGGRTHSGGGVDVE